MRRLSHAPLGTGPAHACHNPLAAEVHMQVGTYRGIVIGSLLSSFLLGFHLPALHDMIEHGAAPRWDVLAVTVVFVVGTVAGGWTLLRARTTPPGTRARPQGR